MKERIFDLIATAGLYLAVYFAPTATAILTIGFFVVCDTITGIMAARARKEEITSKKLRRTAAKFLSYGIGILVAHVVQKNYLPTLDGVKLISGLIAFIELKSIDENMKTITGFSLFKFILEKLKPKDS